MCSRVAASPGHTRGMSRSRLIDQWEADLRGLTDQGVRDRLQLATKNAADSPRPGMGRNPKAARMWREKAAQATAELERRGLVD
jgi:hypothetical protein